MYFHGTRPSEWYSQEGPHQRGHDPSSLSSGVGRQPPRKMINLEHLTEEERKIIMDVLQRDEQLRQSEQERVKKLKTELHDLRRKSAVKVDETSGGADSSKKVCARCREPLGTIFNSGEVCPRCQHKVCSNCKVVLPSSKKWLCTICNKQLQIRLESGDAFGPIKEGQAPVYGSDLVKMSLAKTKPELEHKVLINGSPQSPADSGFHGRGANVSSVGESTMYEDDYPSDISNEQSIGPSVSEHGSIAHRGPGPATNNDEGTIVRNDMDRGHYDAADITVERVSSRNGSPGAGQRGNAADAIQYEKSSSRRHHGHVTSEGSEDERSYRSNGSGGRHPAIPTIAIQDAGDSSFSESEYYYSGSERLHRQALEANLYRDSNATDHTDGAVPTSNATKGNQDDSKVTPNGRAGRAQKKDKPGTVPALQIDPPSDKPTTPASQFVEVHVDIEREPTFKPELSKVDDRLPSLPQDDESIGKADSLPRFASRSSASSVSSPVERRLSKKNMQFKPKVKKRFKPKGSTSSLTSLYSTGEEFYGKYPITGDVSFGLGYNFKTNVFEIKIGGCRDLVPIEAKKNKSDPYIKTYLLPDKSKNSKRKTKTKKGTINPNYSENLKYPIPQSELETRTLSVAVWHYDRFGHNMFLGEVLVPLDGVDLTSYPVKWHQLKTRVPPTETKPISYKGDIVLALMFETLVDENKNGTNGSTKTASRRKKKGLSDKQIGGTLKVHIKEAKNLTPPRVGAAVNPYVKVYLEPDRSKTGKKKTATMRNTINPSYEQSLEYPNMTEDILKERALEVGIWDSEVGSSSLLGGVRLGPGTGKSYGRGVDWQDSTGIEIQLWEEMLRNHNQWVEASLTLRASFDKKT